MKGSSPRMRGARPACLKQVCQGRIIRADAGSTTTINDELNTRGDHPRGCGEHICRSGWNRYAKGSSPQMRGARWVLPCRPTLSRIIPADAGSTSPLFIVICDKMGSSPRMRGAPSPVIDLECALGIIPADAGSTRLAYREPPPRQDHPRGCGEHSSQRFAQSVWLGSSPRMRGAR